MKHCGRIAVFLVLISLGCSFSLLADQAEGFKYPIKPGTPAWQALDSTLARISLLQIPEYDLERMTTEELLQTCLNYPFNIDVMLFTQYQDGFNSIKNHFNGMRELLKRKNSFDVLFPFYLEMNSVKVNQILSPNEQGKYLFETIFLELLLAQDEFLMNLSKDKRLLLLEQTLIRFNTKNSNNPFFKSHSLNTSLLLLARIMKYEKDIVFEQELEGNKRLNQFIQNGTKESIDMLIPIAYYAQNLVEIRKNSKRRNK